MVHALRLIGKLNHLKQPSANIVWFKGERRNNILSTMMVIKKEGGEAEEEDDMDVTEKQKKKLYKFVKLMKGVSDDLLEYVKDMKTYGGLRKAGI